MYLPYFRYHNALCCNMYRYLHFVYIYRQCNWRKLSKWGVSWTAKGHDSAYRSRSAVQGRGKGRGRVVGECLSTVLYLTGTSPPAHNFLRTLVILNKLMKLAVHLWSRSSSSISGKVVGYLDTSACVVFMTSVPSFYVFLGAWGLGLYSVIVPL